MGVALNRHPNLPRYLLNTAIGAVAFALTCLGLKSLLPFPEIDKVSQKLRFFTAHKDEYDTLFIGSSRIYYQIAPTIFDLTTRANGQPTHSFNFGIDGMHLPESIYVGEQILKTKPARLRWVIVELDELQTNWFFQGEGTRRALYWHDWKRTSLVLRKIVDAGTNPLWLSNPLKQIRNVLFRQRTRDLFVFHTSQFEKNFTNLGRIGDILDHLSRGDTVELTAKQLGPAQDGYVPAMGKMSAAQTERYEKTLAEALARTEPKRLSPVTEKACRQCAEIIRHCGAVPIFLVTPTATVQTKFTFHDGSEPPGVVISFNDARAYPDLYRSSVRIDPSHITKPAAEEFTRLVAADFVKLMRAGKIK